MNNRCTRTVSVLIGILFGALPSSAGEIAIVRGQLRTLNPVIVQGLVVSIEGISNHIQTAETDVRGDGSLEFRDIPAGDYNLRVTDGRGLTICEQLVTVQEDMPVLDIRMPEHKPAGGKAATVSLTQLMHPPQKKAVQAFERASRLSSEGKYEESAVELEKAIRISPEFGGAHTNLAVQYFRLRRFEESAAESARAIQISGPDPLNLCNLANAQAKLHRFEEAEKSARAALQLDSGYVKANLLLGSILVNEPSTRGEGIRHLEKAAATFDSARVFLDKLRESH